MWPSLLKIQYTELKLSCGNDHAVKNSIYSNSDLDLWPNDPKIYRILPLPQGNHVVKFGKDPIYRTSYHVEKTVVKNYIYSNGDLMTPKYIGFFPFHRGIMWPSLVKIWYTELKLLCGNLCGRPPAIPNHIIRTVSRRAYKKNIIEIIQICIWLVITW